MLVGFKKQFVRDVLWPGRGGKRQTIRALRKRPFRVGDSLQLYTGLRTKNCQKLGDAVCTDLHGVTIGAMTVIVGGLYLNDYQIDQLACADGFDSAEDFFAFFKTPKGTPFIGQLIQWDDIQVADGAMAWLEAMNG